MTVNVKNIYCVGRNYAQHAKELNNAVPESPLVFTKTTHALVEANGQEVILPGNFGRMHYEAEFVIHIARQYEPGIKIDDLIDKMAIGIDFTLRDLQDDLRQKGYPWVLAKGFLNSAVISPWYPFEGLTVSSEKDFSLVKNGQEVQRGNIKDMIFDLPVVTEYIAKHLGLGAGDIVFTGTPEGVGPVSDGDQFIYNWGEKQIGSSIIRLSI
ncbi:MAG: fumarylacetoacetate hydrolase [Gracilibacter sp. BRH_c7a]|nr:MAG: fumarylacetoacetate hydrolase [Gracilibacter sp. BRH_c7a]